jgi:A/G-specific adenine glycosylase
MHSDKIDEFRNSLLQWYDKNRRPFPWREQPTPYRVWISEIMLQQTQTKSAMPYYNRFLERFPDIKSLAHASEEQILALWSGLGYYSRARNLRKAAVRIVACHKGIFPSDIEDVLALPGVGRYTAGAICSIAFNQPHPVVDGNIRRVIARLKGIRSRIPEKYFWGRMAEWIPKNKASAFNQAMMELGAVICLPSRPLCSECPVAAYCLAKIRNLQDRIPPPKPRKAVKRVDVVVLVVQRRGRILLMRQQESFIPGVWGLPTGIVPPGRLPDETVEFLNKDLFGGRLKIENVSILRHSITNHSIAAHIYTGNATGLISERVKKHGEARWAGESRLNESLTSSLFRKAVQRCRGRSNGE